MENTTMTIEEMIAQMEALKEEYYEIEGDEDAEKAIYEKALALELRNTEFLIDEVNTRGNFYVCPDREWEFPHVFEIAEEYMANATTIIAKAYLEYYRDSRFCDTADINRDTLVAMRLRAAQIPIIRHAGVAEVELLNVRWLNRNC